MKKFTTVLIVIGVIVLGISIAMGMHHAIKIQKKAGIGKYLTDTDGKTLYWFKKDCSGESACAGDCLEKWPIYYRETVAAPNGIKRKSLEQLPERMGRNRQLSGAILYITGIMTKKQEKQTVRV